VKLNTVTYIVPATLPVFTVQIGIVSIKQQIASLYL